MERPRGGGCGRRASVGRAPPGEQRRVLQGSSSAEPGFLVFWLLYFEQAKSGSDLRGSFRNSPQKAKPKARSIHKRNRMSKRSMAVTASTPPTPTSQDQDRKSTRLNSSH